MKFWTVQPAQVLNEIVNDGVYYPDFRRSTYLSAIPALADIYELFLNSFNLINNISPDEKMGQGLIFAFSQTAFDNRIGKLVQINDINDFHEVIVSKKAAIQSLWGELGQNLDQKLILEVELDQEFLNPLLIDINDFQFLMPPISFPAPYQEADVNRITTAIRTGDFPRPIFPSGLMQAHLPYLKKADVVNAYHMFALE
ncbi:hypothetical protein ACFQ4L_01940 [Lapidilactobacillus mulanensis]|uniref:Uncharacterized protein n=1 Tax=Lapidilactobacillus mulanensis TaxID=2485999 RepID=A0ABW4DMU3_9LACO|nr:hypothetical protein [Lapidilactobacillus mulanensis]